MILFFNSQPVSEQVKISYLIERAKELYGSDFYDIDDSYWFGDNLTVRALFPSWIMDAYEKEPNTVLVIPIIKNYLRWLFSLEYGYGAQLNWETLRYSLKTNSKFLEAYADFYFPDVDFSQEPYASILPNIRKFLINADANYFNEKGTPQATKYLICTLLGFDWDSVDVFTVNAAVIQVNTTSANSERLKQFRPFLEEHVLPAGMSVIYGEF